MEPKYFIAHASGREKSNSSSNSTTGIGGVGAWALAVAAGIDTRMRQMIERVAMTDFLIQSLLFNKRNSVCKLRAHSVKPDFQPTPLIIENRARERCIGDDRLTGCVNDLRIW
jgi:hypothetical protein